MSTLKHVLHRQHRHVAPHLEKITRPLEPGPQARHLNDELSFLVDISTITMEEVCKSSRGMRMSSAFAQKEQDWFWHASSQTRSDAKIVCMYSSIKVYACLCGSKVDK